MGNYPTFDRGTARLFDVTFKQYVAHVTTPVLFNPTSATITVVDPTSTARVTNAALTQTNANSTGLYHYVLQTSTNWPTGIYETQIRAYDGSYLDVTIDEQNFELE